MTRSQLPIQIDLSSMQGADLDEFQKVLRNLSRNSIYFENFMRRKFHIPRGYIPWDEFAADLSLNLMAADNISLDEMDYASINSALMLRNIHNEQPTIFPCYWLNENLMQAFLNTKLPKTMEIKRSHFYATIFLPKNLLR